jgi:hypothetical protein
MIPRHQTLTVARGDGFRLQQTFPLLGKILLRDRLSGHKIKLSILHWKGDVSDYGDDTQTVLLRLEKIHCFLSDFNFSKEKIIVKGKPESSICCSTVKYLKYLL